MQENTLMIYKFGCIYDESSSFGIDGPKVVFVVPLESIKQFAKFLEDPNNMNFSKTFNSHFYGIHSFHYQIEQKNSLSIVNGILDFKLNSEGLKKILSELQLLSKQGSFTYLDFDEEFNASPWIECILSISSTLYEKIT